MDCVWSWDLDKNDIWHSPSYAHNYWMVDMERETFVKHVNVKRRTDINQLTNYDIYIGNNYDPILNEKCPGGPFSGDEYAKCELTGRFLTVQSNVDGSMSLCEVEAFST